MNKKKIIQAVIFLLAGAGLFWLVFRNTDINEIFSQLARFSLLWIAASVAINLISQVIRAHRWKLLFNPLNYNPKTYNLFFALIVLSFTNQVIPRGGEVARLGMIHRVEKIPFSKLAGIALAERLTDLIVLILISVVLIVWQFSSIQQLLHLPEVDLQSIPFLNILTIVLIFIIIITALTIAIKKFGWFKKVRVKIRKIKRDIAAGFSSIRKLKRKPIYILETILIYTLWLLALYVIFYAYPPTADLSLKAAVFTFGLATLAFLLPIQSGLGAWHFIVIQCLILYGIDAESGKAFSLVAHAATNLIFIVLGAITFILITLVNKKNKS